MAKLIIFLFTIPRSASKKAFESTLTEMRDHFARYPGRFCAIMIEIIQGERRVQFCPATILCALFEEARKLGLAILADEIQTFGRTGELFAYQKFGLNEYIDVVTVAKMLQASIFRWTRSTRPSPGWLQGRFPALP